MRSLPLQQKLLWGFKNKKETVLKIRQSPKIIETTIDFFIQPPFPFISFISSSLRQFINVLYWEGKIPKKSKMSIHFFAFADFHDKMMKKDFFRAYGRKKLTLTISYVTLSNLCSFMWKMR